MQQETANVILPAEPELLAEHLRARREEGVRMNVNYLGESLLGEEDAQRGCRSYLAALQQPEVEVMSVKISTIYSQISGLAREHTIDVLCDRLEFLYPRSGESRVHAARRHSSCRSSSTSTWKSTATRSSRPKSSCGRSIGPGWKQAPRRHRAAGLHPRLVRDAAADHRVGPQAASQPGGAPVTIRIVKGANMEMERVEASLRGWPQAPYNDQARDRRQLPADAARRHAAGEPRRRAARHRVAQSVHARLRPGARAQAVPLDRVQFEMLEGMANHQRRALFELTGNMLLYAPACRQEDFINAIGYLIRRLDENTGPDNFLATRSTSKSAAPTWNTLEQQFVASVRRAATRVERTTRAHAGSQARNEASRGVLAPEITTALRGRRSHTGPRTPGSLRIPQRTRHRLVAPAKRRLGRIDHRQLATTATATTPPKCRS